MAAPAHGVTKVEFSHKRHAALKLPCVHCHSGALTEERAAFPGASGCLECHQAISGKSPALEAVRTLSKDAKPFPTRQVYSLPDFVFFSHGKHAQSGVKCATCHGDVTASDVVTAAVNMKMMWCVGCHKSAGAAVACTACHELSQ